MNVVFLNTLYFPDAEERRRLEKQQEIIYFAKVEYLFQLRHLSASEIKYRKSLMHQTWRNQWEVFVNENRAEEN